MRQIQTLRNLSGRRLFLTTDNPSPSIVGERIGLDRRRAGELLKGNPVRQWEKTEYQRFRDNMRISFRLTLEGKCHANKARGHVATLYSILYDVDNDGKEATQIAEELAQRGLIWSRQRVLQELARHVKIGNVVKIRLSGAINF